MGRKIFAFLVALLPSEILDQSLPLVLFATALGNQRAKTSRKKKPTKSIGSLSDFESDACHWARTHFLPLLPSDQLN